MSKLLVEGVVCALSLITLAIVVILIIFLCKPIRFFSSFRIHTIKAESSDLERPLVNNHQTETHPLDVHPDTGSKTLKRTNLSNHSSEPEPSFVNEVLRSSSFRGSCLLLEVISGPSRGLRCSTLSSSSSKLPLTIGRVSCDLLIKDSEVSGRHAMVTWNANKLKWEILDMGSLNGTLLNSKPVNDSGIRKWSDPVEISSGDIITLGSSSNLRVLVSHKDETQAPFAIGLASDPMALRRGGKKLPMEDVSFSHWPLPGVGNFGVFGICDGHGGVSAAKFAGETLPEKVASFLSDSLTRQRVVTKRDASDVLRNAFYETETSMNYYYEGCTATLLVVWLDDAGNVFAQCANVGDSACFIYVQGKAMKMTEDHRVSSVSETLRINSGGKRLRDGETRMCGLNLARTLGDKFLKQQEARFSSEPYVSDVVRVGEGSFAVIASDGLWDVVGVKKAVQIVMQGKEGKAGEGFAERVANDLLNEARILRTKDNTSLIFLDFSCRVNLL